MGTTRPAGWSIMVESRTRNLQRSRVRGCARKSGVEEDTRNEVGRRQGEPESRPMGVRESEGRIRAETLGNGLASGTQSSKGGPCWYEPYGGKM
jgi:hypothetical protein